MARRTIATIKRPTPHVFVTGDAPGVCGRCHLVERNAVHVDENDPLLLQQHQEQDEHRRRVGDQL